MRTIATYSEKLKDPRWQRRRLEILSRDNWACVDCEAKESTLHVDHRIYRKGQEPWEYADQELQTLCEACHKRIEEERKALKESMSRFRWKDIELMVGFAEGLRFLEFHEEEGHRVALTGWGHACGFVAAVADVFPHFTGDRAVDSVIELMEAGATDRDHFIALIMSTHPRKGGA